MFLNTQNTEKWSHKYVQTDSDGSGGSVSKKTHFIDVKQKGDITSAVCGQPLRERKHSYVDGYVDTMVSVTRTRKLVTCKRCQRKTGQAGFNWRSDI